MACFRCKEGVTAKNQFCCKKCKAEIQKNRRMRSKLTRQEEPEPIEVIPEPEEDLSPKCKCGKDGLYLLDHPGDVDGVPIVCVSCLVSYQPS